MTIRISKYHPHEIVKGIASALKVPLEKDCFEECLKITPPNGKGRIYGYCFSNGLGLAVFDCKLEKDCTLQVKASSSMRPLTIHFSVEGKVKHAFGHPSAPYQLKPLQSSITSNPNGSGQQIVFPAQAEILFASLIIERPAFFKKVKCLLPEMPAKLAELFADTEGERSFFYLGDFSLTAAEKIKQILNETQGGLAKSTFLESKALELLSKQIRHFEYDQISNGHKVLINQDDVEKIKKAREILVNSFDAPPTIEQLAKKVAINRQKLKTGFKKMYGKSIKKYLQEERMNLARLILSEGTLSIREAATAVGYSNQSHFSKAFRKKFGLLPKDFVKTTTTDVSN